MTPDGLNTIVTFAGAAGGAVTAVAMSVAKNHQDRREFKHRAHYERAIVAGGVRVGTVTSYSCECDDCTAVRAAGGPSGPREQSRVDLHEAWVAAHPDRPALPTVIDHHTPGPTLDYRFMRRFVRPWRSRRWWEEWVCDYFERNPDRLGRSWQQMLEDADEQRTA